MVSVGVGGLLLLQCAEGAEFSSDIFNQPATGELANTQAGGLLRDFLASADGALMPQRGWWLAGDDGQTITFLAQDPGGDGYVDVSFRIGARGWEIDSYGACLPSVVLPIGLGTASWMLDPNQLPGADDTEFLALVTERACASGRSAEGRIAPATIVYEQERILVLIAVGSPTGDVQTCQSNPQTPFVIRLAEPIGERRLLDGSFFPPHDPTQPLP